jgi:tape measure domain-containing protein
MQSAWAVAKQWLAFAGIGLGVKQLIDYADGYRLVEGRIKLTTKSTDELRAVEAKLFEVANATRTSYAATADLYSKVARSSGELGISQRQVVTLTQAVGQALQISGASTGEATAATLQLGQAFSSARLSGDELRSVLENAPRLAKAVADGMGVTVGQLRTLGSQGKLTGEAVAKAILSQADALNREFKSVPLTIGQSFTVLGNYIQRYVGWSDRATGASALLARTIILLAHNVDLLANFAIYAGVVFLLYRNLTLLTAGMAIARVAVLALAAGNWAGVASTLGLTAAVNGLKAAIASTGIGLLLIAIGAIAVALYTWYQRTKQQKEALRELSDEIKKQKQASDSARASVLNEAAADQIRQQQQLEALRRSGPKALERVQNVQSDENAALEEGKRLYGEYVKKSEEAAQARGKAITVERDFTKALAGGNKEAQAFLLIAAETALRKRAVTTETELVTKAIEIQNDRLEKEADAWATVGQAVRQAQRDGAGLKTLTTAYQNAETRARAAAGASGGYALALGNELRAIENYVKEAERATEIGEAINGLSFDAAAIVTKEMNARYKLADALDEQTRKTKDLARLQAEAQNRQLKATLPSTPPKSAFAQANDAEEGDIAARIQARAQEMKLIVENVFRGMQESAAQFFLNVFTQGIRSFRDLFNSIRLLFLQMLAQLAAAKLVTKLRDTIRAQVGGVSEDGLTKIAPTSPGYGTAASKLGAAGQVAGAVGFVASIITGFGNTLAKSRDQAKYGGAALGFAAFGPVGALAGAALSLAGFDKKAKAAAKAMAEAQKEFARNLDSFVATAFGTGSGLADALRANQQARDELRKEANVALSGKKNEKVRNQQLEEIDTATKANAARLAKEFTDGIEAQINALTGKSDLNARAALEKEYAENLRNAAAAGSDAARVTELYNLKLKALNDEVARAAASIGANVGAREALLGGRGDEAQGIAARETAAAALFEAQKLYQAGTISEELFKRLAAVIEGELNRSLDQIAQEAKQRAGDLEARRLTAAGQTQEADALRFKLAQEKELNDAVAAGTSAAEIATLRYVQALEAEAFAKAQAQQKADAAGEFQVRALLAQGRTQEADAMRIQLANEKELRDARELGIESLVKETQALEAATRAREAAAAAANALADLEIRKLQAEGRTADADARRLDLQQAQEREQFAKQFGEDSPVFKQLLEVQRLEKERKTAEAASALAGSTSAAPGPSNGAVVSSGFQAISREAGDRLADYGRTALIVFREIRQDTATLPKLLDAFRAGQFPLGGALGGPTAAPAAIAPSPAASAFAQTATTASPGFVSAFGAGSTGSTAPPSTGTHGPLIGQITFDVVVAADVPDAKAKGQEIADAALERFMERIDEGLFDRLARQDAARGSTTLSIQ